MARPIKFTTARQKVALEALRDGLTRTAAAAEAGVHYMTFRRHLDDNAKFCEAVELAEAECDANMIRQAIGNKHGTDVPKADAKWWLERRRRQDWGIKQDVNLTLGKGDAFDWAAAIGISEARPEDDRATSSDGQGSGDGTPVGQNSNGRRG